MSQTTFAAFELDAGIQKALKELGFARPTGIQAEAIPAGLAGKDLLACAATGSGKTLAFLLPIVHRLAAKPRGRTRALVLTPTRELAAQILEAFNDVAVHTGVQGAAIYGGVGMGPQEHALRSGCDVIVATPGRLLDHMKQPYANFEHLDVLVLDEADRMLDMGFLPDIKRILKQLPAKRQTMFFSATMPREIMGLTQELLHHPVTLNVERQGQPATGITQALYPVPHELKSHLFLHLLKRGDLDEALVFTRTKHRANRLAEFLVKQGIAAERIHGNRSQGQRMAALDGFKSGKFKVLVATDIAARGIDINELPHVVNFDVPVAPEDYVHRVGRTARAGATGDAFTFVAPDEEEDVTRIERVIKKKIARVTLTDFDYAHRPAGQLEVPLKERIEAIRAQKRLERERAKINAERRAKAAAEREAAEQKRRDRDAQRASQGGARPRPTGGQASGAASGRGVSGGAPGGPSGGSGPSGGPSGGRSGSGPAGRRRRRRR